MRVNPRGCNLIKVVPDEMSRAARKTGEWLGIETEQNSALPLLEGSFRTCLKAEAHNLVAEGDRSDESF